MKKRTPEESAALKSAQELESRIQANPRKTLKITQEFYAEKAQAGATEEAHLALLMKSMLAARDGERGGVPAWFPIAGFTTGGVTLLFFMGLVFASMWGHTVPPEARFLLHLVFALGSALCVTFLGGEAAASGKIPLIGKHPLAFSVSGGIAVLVILLALLHRLYA
jgi:hypothetical protein